MKDQYFGDVNDFRKYAILRVIARSAKLRLGVCWMLTASDGRTDGRHLSYLTKRDRYQQFDRELFDWLVDIVQNEKDRRTARIESTMMLGRAVFHSELLNDNSLSRHRWFSVCVEKFRDCELVFFDPDNGIERSVPYGRRNSCKFLYWEEVRRAFACGDAGASVLIYQHFPREPRHNFINSLAARLRAETGSDGVFSFRTPHVVFLLASHARHVPAFRTALGDLKNLWRSSEIDAKEH